MTSSGGKKALQLIPLTVKKHRVNALMCHPLEYLKAALVFLLLFIYQNPRDDSLVPNSMVTPQKPGSCIENALHKDVFGVISGTGKYSGGR